MEKDGIKRPESPIHDYHWKGVPEKSLNAY